MKRLAVIDDNPDYGGHQIMAGRGIEGLLEATDSVVDVYLHPGNAKNAAMWAGVAARNAGRLQVMTAATRSVKFGGWRHYLDGAARRRLAAAITASGADAVLLLQGNIEHSSAFLHGRAGLRVPVYSYIPLPHSHAQMGARLGWLRDLGCRRLWAGADGWITLSASLAAGLRANGVRAPIKVVENGIPLERFAGGEGRAAARRALGLAETGWIWLHPGRVENKQKGQDFSLAGFRRYGEADAQLLYLGDGPDAAALDTQIGGDARVRRLPWTDTPERVIAAADAVVLPSRYEGVPLVMLEALAAGKPVVATDRDGMRDYLPDAWRFRYQDLADFGRALAAVRQAPEAVEALRERVLARCGVGEFKRNFAAALVGLKKGED